MRDREGRARVFRYPANGREDAVSVGDASSRLRVEVATVERWARIGWLRGSWRNAAGEWRVPRESLEQIAAYEELRLQRGDAERYDARRDAETDERLSLWGPIIVRELEYAAAHLDRGSRHEHPGCHIAAIAVVEPGTDVGPYTTVARCSEFLDYAARETFAGGDLRIRVQDAFDGTAESGATMAALLRAGLADLGIAVDPESRADASRP